MNMTMKMKKVTLTTKHKFNIKQSVGVNTTYHFSLGVVKNTVVTALKNNGVQNPDEIIKQHEDKIVLLQNRINQTDTKFESYKKETDKTIAELKDELGK